MTAVAQKLPPIKPPVKSLPPSQQRTLQALINFWAVRKRAPTLMEIANYLGVTRQPAYNCLLALEHKGYCKRDKKTRRFGVTP